MVPWYIGWCRPLPTGDKSPPDKNKAQLLPTWITIPIGLLLTRTTPHQEHYQRVKPFIGANIYMVGNCTGGDLSGYDTDVNIRFSPCGPGFGSHHRSAVLLSFSKTFYPHCCSRPRCINGYPVGWERYLSLDLV